MTPEIENTIRAQARKCIDEYKAATAGKVTDRDAIAHTIILRRYSAIEQICKPFSLFLVMIGRVNGILEER